MKAHVSNKAIDLLSCFSHTAYVPTNPTLTLPLPSSCVTDPKAPLPPQGALPVARRLHTLFSLSCAPCLPDQDCLRCLVGAMTLSNTPDCRFCRTTMPINYAVQLCASTPPTTSAHQVCPSTWGINCQHQFGSSALPISSAHRGCLAIGLCPLPGMPWSALLRS